MSEQNKVILDTSQAKAALTELEALLHKVDKAMDGITAEGLVKAYGSLGTTAKTLRAEFDKVAASTGTSATSQKLYAAQLDSLRAKAALATRQLNDLKIALKSQAAEADKASKAKISYRVSVDGGSAGFSEVSKYTKAQVKELAEAKSKLQELGLANAAVTAKTVAWRKGQQSVEGLREYLGLPRADQAELAKLKAYYTLQAKTASEEIAAANAAVTAKTVAWRKGQQNVEGLREYLGLPRADQAALSQLADYYRKAEREAEALQKAEAKRRSSSDRIMGNFMTAGMRGQQSILSKVRAAATMPSDEATSKFGSGIAGLVPKLGQLEAMAIKAAGATGKFSEAQWNAHSAVRGLAGSLGQLWVTYGNLAPLLAGAAIGSTIASAVKAGTEFEYQLTFVKALGEESSAAVKKLSVAAKELSQNGMYGPVEVAGGLRILTQAGLDAQKALAVLPSTLDLATVGEMRLEEAAVTLVGVMEAFGKKFYESSKVGDVFAKAAAESQVSVMDMTEAMKTASVVGKQYGASMEDTATALTLLGQLNIRGSAAGTALRNMLKEIYTPGKEASDMMAKLGISAFDAEGKIRSFPDIIYDLKKSLEGFDSPSQANILQTLFGERGAKEAIAMISQTRAEWDGLRDSLSNSDGFMREVAAELEATTKGNLAQAFNTLKVAMIGTFESTGGAVGELAKSLKAAFGSQEFRASLEFIVVGVANLTKVIVALTPVIATLAAGWVALKAAMLIDTVVAAAGTALATFGRTAVAVAAGTTTLSAGVKGLGVAMGITAGPIGLAVVALTGFAYWVTQSANAPFTQLLSNTSDLAAAMESLRSKTKSASDALLDQMRVRGLASQTEEVEAEFTLSKARKQLDAAKKQQEESVKNSASKTLLDVVKNPLDVLQGGIKNVKGAMQLSESEKQLAAAEKAYKEALEYKKLREERADTLKMADQIAANAATKPLASGARNIKGEEFIGAGGKAADPVKTEIDKLTKEYDELKKVYSEQPDKLRELKTSYDQQVAAILAKKEKSRGGRQDRTPMKEVDSARKLAEAEYDQAMASVEFYKKGLDLRKNARMVGEAEYQQTLDALAELEIKFGIDREKSIQKAISDALPKTSDKAMREQLEGSLAESLQKERTLTTKAYTDKALAQQREQISRERFLADIEELEAESFDARLTEQERFVKEWNANNKELMDRALVNGDMDSFVKLLNIRERGKEKAAKTDRSNAAADMPGATQVALRSLMDSYGELYARIQAYREQGIVDQGVYNQTILGLETKMQQDITALYIEKARERLDIGTGGWEDMMLVSLSKVTDGFTTFSAGMTDLMGNFFDTFTDGFANSIGRAVVYADDLNSALKSVADEALAGLISGLVKLGIQWLINSAIGQSIQAASMATTMATTSAMATSAASMWAPAAALASLASFGGNSGPAMAGMAATQTLAQSMAAMAGFAGAFDKGGTIPGGKWGIVGEFGPEIVQGPANVTSREKTMEMVRTANQPAAPAQPVAPIVNLKNINVLDKSVVGDYLSSPSGEKLLMNVIQKNRKALA